jgi:DNA-binding transcriptional ArsR family regulator
MTSPPLGVQVIERPETAASALRGTRRTLLAALAEPDSAAGLARRLRLPRQRLNYHLKALEKCGLLECVEERRRGNCTERILRATARAFVISPDALGSFSSTPEAAHDRFSAAYVVAVAARTITEVSALDSRARADERRISTLTLDSEIRFASPESRAAFAHELTDRLAELVAKYHDDVSPRGRRFRLVTIGHPRPDAPPSAPTAVPAPGDQAAPQARRENE